MRIPLCKFSLLAALVGIATVIFWLHRMTIVQSTSSSLATAQNQSEPIIATTGMRKALLQNTSIDVPVSSRVKTVFVKVQGRIKAGAPLLQLDDHELQVQLKTQQAELHVRETEFAEAHRRYEVKKSLLARYVVSRDEFESCREQVAIAQTRVESVRSTIEQTESLINRLIVRAPIAGTVLEVNTSAGEYTMPGISATLILLGSIGELPVRADVDEQIAPRVKPCSKAVGYLKGNTQYPIQMECIRLEPYITPRCNFTGFSTERMDTRVLQVIYKFLNDSRHPIYVGQQMVLFIEELASGNSKFSYLLEQPCVDSCRLYSSRPRLHSPTRALSLKYLCTQKGP